MRTCGVTSRRSKPETSTGSPVQMLSTTCRGPADHARVGCRSPSEYLRPSRICLPAFIQARRLPESERTFRGLQWVGLCAPPSSPARTPLLFTGPDPFVWSAYSLPSRPMWMSGLRVAGNRDTALPPQIPAVPPFPPPPLALVEKVNANRCCGRPAILRPCCFS